MIERIRNIFKEHIDDFLKVIPLLSVLATVLGISIQLYFLIKLDSIQFFSWSRVLDDFVIVFGILTVLLSVIGTLYYTVEKKNLKIVLFLALYLFLILLSLSNHTQLLSNWIFPLILSIAIIIPLIKFIFVKDRKIKEFIGWKKIFNPFIKALYFLWNIYAVIFVIIFVGLIIKSTGEFLDRTYKFNFTYEDSSYISGKKIIKPIELEGIYSNGSYIFTKAIKNDGDKKYESVIVIPTRNINVMFKRVKEIK